MVQPDALNALYSRPGFMLTRSSQVGGGYFERACADLGLTVRQYDVLFVLHCQGRCDQDRLARILGLDKSNAGLVVGNLERKKLIRRIVKSEDRRKRTLSITDAGEALFSAALPHAEEAQQRLLAPLSPAESQQLLKLLTKIVVASAAAERAPLELVGSTAAE